MKSTMARLLIAAALVFVVDLGVRWVRGTGKPEETHDPPGGKLDDMPMRFGQWVGTKEKITDEMFIALDAKYAESRTYQDASYRTISLHVAVTTDYGVGIEHFPLHCLRSQGFTKQNAKTVELKLPDGSKARAALVTVRKNKQDSMTLYWYHLGEDTVLDHDEQRAVRTKLRGRKKWPPQIKVLLSTSAANPEKAERRLLAFAKLVRQWTDKYNGYKDKSATPSVASSAAQD